MTTAITIRRKLLTVVLLAGVFLAASTAPARADITAFLGVSPTPDTHAARGFAGGLSLIILGFEVEYSQISEDTLKSLPGLKTYSGNVFVQTPVEIKGTRLYATAGGGGYRESLGPAEETHVGINLGGGAKIRVLGPLRVRVDYRIFRLQGSPLHATYQRFYVGGNVAF